MNGLDEEPDDATPRTPEECEGLIPSHVTRRGELNELEQQNILKADPWALTRRRNPIDEAFGRSLHRRMFGDVWRWAGTYRTTNKNLGVDRLQIQVRLHETFENMRYWVEQATFPGMKSPRDFIMRSSPSIRSPMETAAGRGSWRTSWLFGSGRSGSLGAAALCAHPMKQGDPISKHSSQPTITILLHCSRSSDREPSVRNAACFLGG